MNTYFIRDNNKLYNEPCDIASMKLIKNGVLYYAGVQWGVHTPTDSIYYISIMSEEKSFYDWITSLGYDIFEE